MVKTVQQASKDIRRGFRMTDEEIVPNSGKAKDVIQSRCVSQTGYVIQILQSQERRTCSTKQTSCNSEEYSNLNSRGIMNLTK